jgi:predicted DNA binding CopG/RHH family protein
MQLNSKKKKLPKLSTTRAAEKFVATADLTRYDLSGMVPARFEFKPKTERVIMRLSKDLLEEGLEIPTVIPTNFLPSLATALGDPGQP